MDEIIIFHTDGRDQPIARAHIQAIIAEDAALPSIRRTRVLVSCYSFQVDETPEQALLMWQGMA